MDREQFDNIIKDHFAVALSDADKIFAMLIDDNMAYNLYVIAHYAIVNYPENSFDYVKFVNYYAKVTTCYVSPYANLGTFELHGINIYIGDNVVAQDHLVVGGGCVIGKNQANSEYSIKKVTIGNNCVIGNNVKIYPGTIIGDNVTVCDGAIIKEKIDNNVQVDIVNQLQVKSMVNARISSQNLFVYGIVPKYKNTFVVFGEGFYNPKVILKLKSGKNINYEISYWDKNKIIVKLKESTPIKDDENMLIVMSNGIKVTLFNSFGIKNALKSINL